MRRIGPRQQRVLPRAPVSNRTEMKNQPRFNYFPPFFKALATHSPSGRTRPANSPLPPFPSSCLSFHRCPCVASPLTIAMSFLPAARAARPPGLSCALTRSGHNKCFVNAVAGIRLPEGTPCTGHNQCEHRCDKSQWVCGGATRSRRAIEADAAHADDVEAVRCPGSRLTCPRCSCCCCSACDGHTVFTLTASSVPCCFFAVVGACWSRFGFFRSPVTTQSSRLRPA